MKLLAWREIEVRESQQIALSFPSTRHVLFPTKHPLDTFSKLLATDPSRYLYLSHPISVPRREELAVSQSSELQNFVEEVACHLRQQPDLLVFEPTTIDEWRMDRDVTTGDIRSHELKPRWPPARSPDGTECALLANPLTATEIEHAGQPFASREESLESLKILSQEIRSQIGWRDRMMVEQSARPLILRPFASSYGRASGGVLDETALHEQLVNYFDLDRVQEQIVARGESSIAVTERFRSLGYHPPRDELSRCVGALVEVLEIANGRHLIVNWPAGDQGSRLLLEFRSELRQALVEGPWLEMSDHDIGERIESLLGHCCGSKPKPYVVGRVVASALSGRNALYRDAGRRLIGRHAREAMQGGLEESLHFSLRPFAGVTLLRDEVASGTVLAEQFLDHIRSVPS